MKYGYGNAVNKYLQEFEAKHDVTLEFWVKFGQLACFGDVYLDFCDMIYDMEFGQPVERIFEWYWDDTKEKVSYKDYCKREVNPDQYYADKEKSLRKSKKDVEKCRKYLEELTHG